MIYKLSIMNTKQMFAGLIEFGEYNLKSCYEIVLKINTNQEIN